MPAIARVNQVNGSFDTHLQLSYQQARDKGILSDKTRGENRTQFQRSISLSKVLTTGTALKLATKWDQAKIDYEDNYPQDFMARYNPGHEISYELTIQQPLWKNFFGKLPKIQKSLLNQQALNPQYKLRIDMQNHLSKTETYYWQLISTNEQIRILKNLVGKSQRFVEAMKANSKVGRSDEVDVATAESALIQHEELLLKAEITQTQLTTQLKYMLYGKTYKVIRVPRSIPRIPPLKLRYQRASQAIAQISKDRIDLQLTRNLQESAKKQQELAREQSKPEINAFASIKRRGISSTESDAIDDLNNGTVSALGLSLDWNLETRESKHSIREAEHKIQELNADIRMVTDTVARELEMSYGVLAKTNKLIQLKQRHIHKLRRKVSAERKKLAQVRSDDSAVIRYDIEILMAQLESSRAKSDKMTQSARIRGLTHSYHH